MKDIWDACKKASIAPPKEVGEFFDWCALDSNGIEVALGDTDCCAHYFMDSQEGYELLVDKLPKDVTVVRFYNSW